MYGHKLEELDIEGNSDDMAHYLRYCPSIKKIISRHNSYLYNNDKEFLPKLERIESIICIFPSGETSNPDVNDLKILSDKYSLSMKTLNLKFDYLKAEELKTCIDCLSRFENLRQLTLSFDYSNDRELIDESIGLIGRKCTKVFELDLRIKGPVLISDRFFTVLPNFKAIKKIKLYFPYIKSIDGSVECFKHCKQLNELDINYPQITEDFFTNIASFVPKLQSLRIKNHKHFSDSFINSFHSMKSVQKVVHIVDRDILERKHFKIWYFGKSLSEVMLSLNGMNVKPITDNCGLNEYKEF